jgi:hypothetical protein
VKNEGIGALYKGLVPNSVKVRNWCQAFSVYMENASLMSSFFNVYSRFLIWTHRNFLTHCLQSVFCWAGGSFNSPCICDIWGDEGFVGCGDPHLRLMQFLYTLSRLCERRGSTIGAVHFWGVVKSYYLILSRPISVDLASGLCPSLP